MKLQNKIRQLLASTKDAQKPEEVRLTKEDKEQNLRPEESQYQTIEVKD